MTTIVTPDFILDTDLKSIGFCDNRKEDRRVNRNTNLTRFRAHFGSNPMVYAEIWRDMKHITTLDEAGNDVNNPTSKNITMFLMAMHFLRCYPTEAQLSALFHACERSARTWCRFYARKIQALKPLKIVWPSRWIPGHIDFVQEDVPVFLLSVDGIHGCVFVPQHPTKSKDKSYYASPAAAAPAAMWSLPPSVLSTDADSSPEPLQMPPREPATTTLVSCFHPAPAAAMWSLPPSVVSSHAYSFLPDQLHMQLTEPANTTLLTTMTHPLEMIVPTMTVMVAAPVALVTQLSLPP